MFFWIFSYWLKSIFKTKLWPRSPPGLTTTRMWCENCFFWNVDVLLDSFVLVEINLWKKNFDRDHHEDWKQCCGVRSEIQLLHVNWKKFWNDLLHCFVYIFWLKSICKTKPGLKTRLSCENVFFWNVNWNKILDEFVCLCSDWFRRALISKFW